MTLKENSKDKQEEFIKQTKVNEEYVRFKKKEDSNTRIEVMNNSNKYEGAFNEYLKKDNRTIYLAKDIDDFYYIEGSSKYKMKDYIMNAKENMEDAVKK